VKVVKLALTLSVAFAGVVNGATKQSSVWRDVTPEEAAKEALAFVSEYSRTTGKTVTAGARNQILQSVLKLHQEVVARQETTGLSCVICDDIDPAAVRFDWRKIAMNFLTPALESLPVIKVIVIPDPPRDYRVTINSQETEQSEKGLYVVPPGSWTVRIERRPRPVCERTGFITAGQNQTVNCKIE
jgi:hypothetical protein